MRFVKSHGAGNDFVLLEDLDDELRLNSGFVAAVCDRHFGVGADGLIRIVRAQGADFFMDYYNANGEVAEMCGNGIRCLAKYVADRKITASNELNVDTRAGVKHVQLFRDDDGMVERARVDMDAPILERALIPMNGEGDPQHERVHGFDAACLSMGNPHCVLFVEELAAAPFDNEGPAIEADTAVFPNRTNVEFVQVLNEGEVKMRVYERGVGETMACGSGACAVGVAAALRGFTGRSVAVHLPGGTLDIEWAPDDHVYMTGPVEEAFDGELSQRLAEMLLQNVKG